MRAQRAQQLGGTLPGLNQPIEKFPVLAQLADQAGFDSVRGYEFYRNAFVMTALAAQCTSKIKLRTGLATAAFEIDIEPLE